MADLDNTQTLAHLKDAYAREAQADTRYAEVAAEEGLPEIARWFLALAETGRTHARWLQQWLDGLEQKP